MLALPSALEAFVDRAPFLDVPLYLVMEIVDACSQTLRRYRPGVRLQARQRNGHLHSIREGELHGLASGNDRNAGHRPLLHLSVLLLEAGHKRPFEHFRFIASLQRRLRDIIDGVHDRLYTAHRQRTRTEHLAVFGEPEVADLENRLDLLRQLLKALDAKRMDQRLLECASHRVVPFACGRPALHLSQGRPYVVTLRHLHTRVAVTQSIPVDCSLKCLKKIEVHDTSPFWTGDVYSRLFNVRTVP